MLTFNLRTRIYLSMLAVVLLAFLASGIAAYYNFKTQNEDYHAQRLERKEEAVTSSMVYFMQKQEGFLTSDSLSQTYSDKICELADIHNLDINLFSLEGDLLISSNSDLIEEKVVPSKIDRAVLKELSIGNNKALINSTYEKGDYKLAYWYLLDYEDAPIAITNVPYFKKEVVNPDEIKGFLIQLAKVYAALFVGASILAIFLANYITKSLQKISNRLQKVSLESKNEPIEWHTKDEIGALVNEYNRMLKEVEESASLLAKSERESAWREMAKQVAHEIKNPLTPMKLQVQHLQRSWEMNHPDNEEKLARFSNAMIEQIDTLSRIANEFSDFAKMPQTRLEEVNLVELINAVVHLFEKTDHINIEVHQHVDSAVLLADKDQLKRVFNNLIKNAIQAINEDHRGIIEIQIKKQGSRFNIEIKDNGHGIPPQIQSKIFTPNFTTKSGGTGLGLAMVKNIVENMKGEISFETTSNVGTTFFLTFPESVENI